MKEWKAESLAQRIVEILEDHKAVEVETMNIKEKSSLADFFVICNGSSETQVRALADHVQYELEKEGLIARAVEGYESSRWILLDYVDVIVHIFHPKERKFYSLEKLWKARPKESETLLSEEQRNEEDLLEAVLAAEEPSENEG